MYAYIKGTVEELMADRAVLDAGGVGYELICSANTLKTLQKGSPVRLLTHFHVTADSMTLYGFYTGQERLMFRRLISVTRVGPKLALSVLSHLSPADVAAAVITDNAAAFDRVPGVGRKSAQRLLLELKEKVTSDDMLGAGIPSPAANGENAGIRAEAVAALVGLGYDGASSSRAVAGISEADSVEELLTKALRSLAKM